MKYQEAQELSVSGVAVLGNPAMQDVIWAKGSPIPYIWIRDGYLPWKPENVRDKEEWSPLHPHTSKQDSN